MQTSSKVYLIIGLILLALLVFAVVYRTYIAPIVERNFPASASGHGHGGGNVGKPVSNIVHENYIRHLEMGDVKPQTSYM